MPDRHNENAACVVASCIGDPLLSRRRMLVASGGLLGAALLQPIARAGAEGELDLATSSLVYVCPLKADGSESACHGEVWFVADGRDALVVTAADRWKAVAIGKGFGGARLWVGEFGPWKKSGGKFRSAPSFDATAAFERDAEAQAVALQAFGVKYPDEWDKWGPRFKDGLADGSRVLIRYSAH